MRATSGDGRRLRRAMIARTVWVPEALLTQVRDRCAASRQPVAAVVRSALRDYVEAPVTVDRGEYEIGSLRQLRYLVPAPVLDAAKEAADNQGNSVADVIRAGMERFVSEA